MSSRTLLIGFSRSTGGSRRSSWRDIKGNGSCIVDSLEQRTLLRWWTWCNWRCFFGGRSWWRIDGRRGSEPHMRVRCSVRHSCLLWCRRCRWLSEMSSGGKSKGPRPQSGTCHTVHTKSIRSDSILPAAPEVCFTSLNHLTYAVT